MSTNPGVRTNALLSLPENRMRVEHTIGAGWTATEYIAGRPRPARSFASWPDLTRYIRQYSGVISCSREIARSLAGGGFQLEEQESSDGI